MPILLLLRGAFDDRRESNATKQSLSRRDCFVAQFSLWSNCAPRNDRHWKRSFIILFLSVLSIRASAQTPSNPPVNITADSLASTFIDGQPVEQLFGNVRFVQGSLYGSSDEAMKYTSGHRIELTGHVEIHQDTLALYAPHATYNDSTGIGHADGGVRMFDRDNELTAAQGDYDVENQVAHFQHHVTLTQGKSTSVSDSLVYYRSTGTSILIGHASVTSDSGSLTGDTITYVRALGETTAKGEVHLSNDSLRLASDWFYDSRPLGEMLARGHVGVEDVQNNTTIFGDTLARFTKGNYTLVPKRPLLLYIDSSQVRDSAGKVNTVLDTMFVRADTMKMYQGDSARLIAIDSVRLLRSNFALTGGELIYDQVHDVMNVFHAPRQHLWNDSTEIDADSVAMLLKNRHINRIFAIGHAFTTSPMEELPNSGRVDQLQGDEMMLVVDRDTARELYDISSALSIYFLLNEGKPYGLNRASGDTIRMDFKDRKVTRIAAISGTEGEYFPERFVSGRAQAFRLTAYERHDALRPRREEFVMPWELPLMIITPPLPTTKSSNSSVPTTPSPAVSPTEHHGVKRNPAH
ncbi:MAG TPA: OstA-like protein [Candidatus Kapabacteria bacterium]|nr:OstA-like protein [Candidatus Kapabacteria bacterium]